MSKVRSIGNVGTSSRTPFKHWLLNMELGRQIGVLSLNSRSVPCKANPLLIVDLCAGDGSPSEYGEQSSPSIILSHCTNPRFGAKLSIQAVFVEKNTHTFESLKSFVSTQNLPPNHAVQCLNVDSTTLRVNPSYRDQAIFINCDPNSISDIPLTPEFMRSMTPYTTMMVTMGCNPAGIKRLSYEARKDWYNYTDLMIKHLYEYHDLILVSLVKDASQWAYLIRTPLAWSKNTLEGVKKAGDKMWKHGVTAFSYRSSQSLFRSELDRLFLTKEELAG